jgi:hypothetical protein
VSLEVLSPPYWLRHLGVFRTELLCFQALQVIKMIWLFLKALARMGRFTLMPLALR